MGGGRGRLGTSRDTEDETAERPSENPHQGQHERAFYQSYFPTTSHKFPLFSLKDSSILPHPVNADGLTSDSRLIICGLEERRQEQQAEQYIDAAKRQILRMEPPLQVEHDQSSAVAKLLEY